MGLQTRIVHFLDPGVGREETRQGEGVGVLGPDAQRQSLGAPRQEKAGVRIERAAEEVERPPHAVHVRPARQDAPGHEIRVAVEILRGAVERHVEPDRQGTEVDGAGEGVVDDRRQTFLARELDDLAQTRNAHQRVGDGLHQEHPRAGAQGLLPGVGALIVDEGIAQSEILRVLRQEVVRAAVQAAPGQKVVALLQERQDGRRHGGHPGRGRQRGLRPLQSRQTFVQIALRRRAVEAGVLDVVIAGARFDREDRALVDGKDDRALRPRPALPRVHRDGLDPVGRLVHGASLRRA